MADGAEASASNTHDPRSGEPFPFKCGWFGDGGLGEKMIDAIVSGRKTATACPVYDPEDAEFREGDRLQLTDKHGRPRGLLRIVKIEVRPLSSFDEALAAREGSGTLSELKEKLDFANGRDLPPNEEMRVVHFEMIRGTPKNP